MTVGSNCFILMLVSTDETEILRNKSRSALNVQNPPKQSTGRVAKNSEMGCKENDGSRKGCDAIVTSHDPASSGRVRHVVQQNVDRLCGSLRMICGGSVL